MRQAAAAGLMLLLAGCSGLELFDSGQTRQPKQIVSSSQLESVLDPRHTGTPQARNRADVPEIAPAALIGASGDQIELWLGAPDALWTEGGHALWRYATSECVVLLFVDPEDTVRKVNVLRMDGNRGPGCERAISERVSGARTS